jgi:hypothetical protein
MTIGAIDALPNFLRETTHSALVFATTDRGNAARMLVAPALHRGPAPA